MKKTLILGIIISMALSFSFVACRSAKPTPIIPTPDPTLPPIVEPTLQIVGGPFLEVISLKIYPTDDSYVIEDQKENFGQEEKLLAGQTIQTDDSGKIVRKREVAFLKFDLGQALKKMPAESEIIKANLNIFIFGLGYPGTGILAPRLKLTLIQSGDWKENELTWDNAPGEQGLIWFGEVPGVGILALDFTSQVKKMLKSESLVFTIGVWPVDDRTFRAHITSKESLTYPDATFLEILYLTPLK